jgi:3,4-dihydroxy 2-butanone 4-phosphate synthase/GTP cyclohydrolase II
MTTMTAGAPALAPAVDALRGGRMVVLRVRHGELTESSLILAAEYVDSGAVNIMSREARGLISLALTSARAEELDLTPIDTRGSSRSGECALISIEARRGVTTGISAADRARTVAVAVDPACGKADLVEPGHVFPLQARPGGVLEHPGRVEAAVDLVEMAGLNPAALICQILREDGDLADDDTIARLSRRLGSPVVEVSEVSAHRLTESERTSDGH